MFTSSNFFAFNYDGCPVNCFVINSTVFEPIYFDCAGEASFDVAIFKLIK
jgi:hypothetical protein